VRRIFIDIETIPDQREGAAEAATSRIRAPSNYKDPDKIKAYVDEKGAEAWRQTSLDGSYGQVFCIGFAVDDEPAQVITVRALDGASEKELLERFWSHFSIPTMPVTWVGHNVLGFDLPFLWKRHVIRGVKPLFPLPYNVGAWSPEIEDTMLMWTGQRSQFIKLDDLLSVLGIPSGDPIEGSEVWDWFVNDRADVIQEHCLRNVEETREAWARMRYVSWL
jgi:predicted PolB exonuclease-like 3'-5' exonuclease